MSLMSLMSLMVARIRVMRLLAGLSHSDVFAGGVSKIEASGDLLAIAVRGPGAGEGIHLIDVGNPSAPNLRSTLPERAEDMILQGNFLFVPNKDGLRVCDVSEPADAVVVGSIVEFDFFASSVAVDGANAFLIGEEKLMTIEGLPGICEPLCGNNQREYPEACDDGNRDDGDDCSADCSSDG
tara:strand:- start:11692 stop:12237 length:546 start_codon:yes stop_codon:yes gene_type:complete